MRARGVGHHDAGRAGDGTDRRRLDHRQHCVAVDLLHQHPGRASSRPGRRGRSSRTRETPVRKLPIDGVGLGLLVLWVGSLQIMLDKGKELDWFHSGFIVALAVTWRRSRSRCFSSGNWSTTIIRSSTCVSSSSAQLLDRLADARARLRRVLRQRRADAAVAAAIHGLHRDRRGPADRAGRPLRHHPVAGRRQVRLEGRPAHLRDGRRSLVFGLALYLRTFYSTRGELRLSRAAGHPPGRGGSRSSSSRSSR